LKGLRDKRLLVEGGFCFTGHLESVLGQSPSGNTSHT
jgi:hypothetical protein